MNSSFVNISSQQGPLCLILLHLSIIKLSYWQSKYDEMHLRLPHQRPLALLKGSQHQICCITEQNHGYFAQYLWKSLWNIFFHSKRPAQGPAFLGARTSEALCNKCVTGSLLGCLSDKVWLVALNFSNGTSNNHSHFQKQYHTFISNPTSPVPNE